MKLIKYCILGGFAGAILNITRILQNWMIARVYNKMALSWNYLEIRAKVQIEIFSVYIFLGCICGITFYIIKNLLCKEKKKVTVQMQA